MWLNREISLCDAALDISICDNVVAVQYFTLEIIDLKFKIPFLRTL